MCRCCAKPRELKNSPAPVGSHPGDLTRVGFSRLQARRPAHSSIPCPGLGPLSAFTPSAALFSLRALNATSVVIPKFSSPSWTSPQAPYLSVQGLLSPCGGLRNSHHNKIQRGFLLFPDRLPAEEPSLNPFFSFPRASF